MEGESFAQDVRGLAVLASFACTMEVIQQHRLIFRVSNLVDDNQSAFFRGQATQVSYAAFGNDNINVMLGVVNMAAERNYGRDSAAFCQGGGEEYGQEAVTSIVAGAAD